MSARDICRDNDLIEPSNDAMQLCFEELYGESEAAYQKFERLDQSEKMILIDDIHLINPKHVSSFLSGIEEEFGYIMYTTSNTIKLDIQERIKAAIATDSYTCFKLNPLYAPKRAELVEKVLFIKNTNSPTVEISQMTSRITQALDLQRRYVPLTPEIIIKFIEYFSTYQMESPQNDGSIFGKVFESSITNALSQPPSSNDIANNKQQDLIKDRTEIENASFDIVNIYDYNEDDINTLENRLTRSISLMLLLARCLPNFEHRLRKSQKERIIKALYTLPNQIYHTWAIHVEQGKEELLELITSMEDNAFVRRKPTLEDAQYILQWNSLSLLLELYHGVVNCSYRENTAEFLTDMASTVVSLGDETHQLEYLLVLAKGNQITEFLSSAEKMKEQCKLPTANLALLAFPDDWGVRNGNLLSIFGDKIKNFNFEFITQAKWNDPTPLLSKENLESVNRLFEFFLNTPNNSLNIAIKRLNRAYTRESEEDAILDLVIAIEALLTDNDHGEITYKVSTRAAWVLSELPMYPYTLIETKRIIAKLYAFRSNIVHGTTQIDKSRIIKIRDGIDKESIPLAIEILQYLILAISHNPRLLNTKELDAYFLDNYAALLRVKSVDYV